MPNGLTAASMASPLMLPTNFEQDPPSLLLGSLFDSPKSQADLTPKSPGFGESPLFYLNETEAPPLFSLNETEVAVKEAEEEPSPRGCLDPEVLAMGGDQRGRLWSQGGEKRLQDTPVLGGITVKHTFLEIQPEWPKVGMRSVQTHSGSLCRMTEQDEDDDDDDFVFHSRLAS